MAEQPIIELIDASFFAQGTRVVRGVSYRFEEGKTTALAGPSGGGKSTVLKLSAGLLVPSQGEVRFRGRDISGMNRRENLAFRKEGAVVFQDSALWANQSLYQILELPLKIHFPEMSGKDRDRRIAEVLEAVGYTRELDIRPSMLSMGEQKLIAFARAMICRPRLLFLDEWTESLDDEAAGRLVALVKSLREGNTIIFVSHDFRIIKNLADYILMIQGGELRLALTAEQIAEDADAAHLVKKGIAS
jgi:ABC-type multidrug transport system ATPase subunit